MRDTAVIIPSFKKSQVDKRLDGTERDDISVVIDNIEANVRAFDGQFTEPENVIFVCAREKMSDGDYRFGIAAIPTRSIDLISIEFNKFEEMPSIVCSSKRDILSTIKKVLNNLIFT